MPKPWWQTDTYDDGNQIPASFEIHEGPHGVALVKSYPSGVTDPGWGLIGPPGKKPGDPRLPGFMPRYTKGEFSSRRVLKGYARGLWSFAFIMRSVRLVCIDIDGKNGGFEHAKRLGMLPKTLAETSKSGNGYHLFYTFEEEWDPKTGFGQLSDRIGIEQGVDVRATGCVYHYDTQRWNGRAPVPLPKHLKELLLHREQKIAAQTERITSVLQGSDEVEILMMHDTMIADLAKPIPAGKRNNTLFAIASQMSSAQVDRWQDKIRDRALEVGLSDEEADKLVGNVERYAPAP